MELVPGDRDRRLHARNESYDVLERGYLLASLVLILPSLLTSFSAGLWLLEKSLSVLVIADIASNSLLFLTSSGVTLEPC